MKAVGNQIKINLSLILSLSFCIIGGGCLIPLASYAEAEVTASLTIASALTMSLDGTIVAENYTGTNADTDTDTDSGTSNSSANAGTKIVSMRPGEANTSLSTEVTVQTNAPQGYFVSLQGVGTGTDGYADLINEVGESIITSSSTTPAPNLDTSTWGIKVEKENDIDDGTDEGFWQAVPDNSGKRSILEIDSTEKFVDHPTTTTVHYGIALTMTQEPGFYTGSVEYIMSANSNDDQSVRTHITYGTVEGVASVSLDGDKCTTPLADGGCHKLLSSGKAYELTTSLKEGYFLTDWTLLDYEGGPSAKGEIKDPTSLSTTFTPGDAVTTIKPIVTDQYIVEYDGNTDFGISNTTGNTEPDAFTWDGTDKTLRENGFTKTGYTFQGWAKTLAGAKDGIVDFTTDNSYPDNVINEDGEAKVTLYAVWKISAYPITYGTVTGISSVMLDGTACDIPLSDGGCSKILSENQQYDLVATAATGYTASGWENVSGAGTIDNFMSPSTKFTVGAGAATLTPKATADSYDITIKTAPGISSVSLNGTTCSSTSGCTVSNLTYGQSYTLTATVDSTDGLSFYSWSQSGTEGTIGDTANASTTFIPGAGTVTITPQVAVDITFSAGTGLISVMLNIYSTNATPSTVRLPYGKSYSLSANILPQSGYVFLSWSQSGTEGIIADTTKASTTFTPGLGATTITASATNLYDITIHTSEGVSSVSLGSTTCESTSSCVVKVLYNSTYSLKATVEDGYRFSMWSGVSSSFLGNPFNASTTFKVTDNYRNGYDLYANASPQK